MNATGKTQRFFDVDVQRGSTRVDFKKQSTTEITVGVVVLTVLIYCKKDLTFYLFARQCQISRKKMEAKCA